jgi:hypothetical protein
MENTKSFVEVEDQPVSLPVYSVEDSVEHEFELKNIKWDVYFNQEEDMVTIKASEFYTFTKWKVTLSSDECAKKTLVFDKAVAFAECLGERLINNKENNFFSFKFDFTKTKIDINVYVEYLKRHFTISLDVIEQNPIDMLTHRLARSEENHKIVNIFFDLEMGPNAGEVPDLLIDGVFKLNTRLEKLEEFEEKLKISENKHKLWENNFNKMITTIDDKFKTMDNDISFVKDSYKTLETKLKTIEDKCNTLEAKLKTAEDTLATLKST